MLGMLIESGWIPAVCFLMSTMMLSLLWVDARMTISNLQEKLKAMERDTPKGDR